MPWTLPRRLALPAAVALLALTAPVAMATPGDLDPTFDGNGKVTTGVSALGQDTAFGVAVQPDGKVVVTGAAETSSGFNDLAVVRYRVDGSLDPDFGTLGKVVIDVGVQDIGTDVAIMGDGRIVVGGYTYEGGDPDVLVVRLTAAGTPDPTFGGGDGIVVTSPTTANDRAWGVVVQPDGRIVVAGETGFTGGAGDMLVIRYTVSGGLDGTFGGGDGIATLDVLGSGRADLARDVALQRDGKLVVAGTAFDGRRELMAVARFTAAGLLDTRFGGNGSRTVSFGRVPSLARSVAVQSDRKIVIAGSRGVGDDANMAVVRLRRNGPLDRTFSGNGKRTVSFGSRSDVGSGVLVPGGGTVIIGGTSLSRAGTHDFALARFTAAGELDPTFGGGDGKVLTDFAGRGDFCWALASAPGGAIVGAGGSRFGTSLPTEDVAVARWLAA